MPRILDAAVLGDVRAIVGEGPLWDERRGVLSWVDIPRGEVHASSAAGQILRSYSVGRAVGAALPAAGGGWLLADADGFTMLAVDGSLTVLLGTLAERLDLRFNDAKCDPAGRAWAGSVAHDLAPGAGSLYRLDPGPVATLVLGGLTVSNGLGWSPDGRTMWFADSALPYISAFEYDPQTGAMGSARQPVPLAETSGVADGLCVDDEGSIWLALWGGGAVHRYTPDGRLDTIVRLPVERVTSCAFGGPHGATLFITTARLDGPEAEREPLGGALFTVTPGVTGPAATPWRLESGVVAREAPGAVLAMEAGERRRDVEHG
jgi:sugar lactone lactonase YvrE